jgi:hypothetical protein
MEGLVVMLQMSILRMIDMAIKDNGRRLFREHPVAYLKGETIKEVA